MCYESRKNMFRKFQRAIYGPRKWNKNIYIFSQAYCAKKRNSSSIERVRVLKVHCPKKRRDRNRSFFTDLHTCNKWKILLRKMNQLMWNLINFSLTFAPVMFPVVLDQRLTNLSCKGSDSDYFKLLGHMVSVTTAQLCCCRS